jgi:hypothetical protein
MKPERIQFAPSVPAQSSGYYRTFQFASLRKAEIFSDCATEMADNHGRVVETSIDSEVNELLLLVPASTVEELDGARTFADDVAEVHARWSVPVVAS